jgi:hypothetical protein
MFKQDFNWPDKHGTEKPIHGFQVHPAVGRHMIPEQMVETREVGVIKWLEWGGDGRHGQTPEQRSPSVRREQSR